MSNIASTSDEAMALESSNSLKVAFLGLGAIGAPMAVHVSRLFPTIIWNRTREKADALISKHSLKAAIAATPQEAAAHADVFITCLPTSHQVEEVLFGTFNAAAQLKRGAIVVDCTSGDPTTSKRIAEKLHALGVDFMDAPVSGGVVGAENAQLTVMCGGSADVLERVRAVLSSFGTKIVHCGDIGTGDALKAVNNALLALHIWSTAEGLTLLKRAGVNPAIALDVINASSGRSNASMNLFPERVLNRSFPNTFRLALLDKDAKIAAHLASELEVPAETIKLASHLFSYAHQELGEIADHVEAVKVVERKSSIEII